MGQQSSQTFQVVNEVQKVARELNTTASAVAVAWTLTRRGVTSVIAGPRSQDQLTDYITGVQLTLPDAAAKRLSDASRPGGPRAAPAAAR
jgi:aryl-alcohol dehydrogenase-like predicted oxidoreductase